MGTRDRIETHLLQRFGDPSREALFVPRDGREVRIWKWDKVRSGEGVSIYVTLGAQCRDPDHGAHSCEFFVGFEPSQDDIAPSLAEVALEGNGTGRIPAAGDTVTLAEPLWAGTVLRTFLFARGEEIIEPIPRPNVVHFIQLVPIFESELSFKKREGHDFLWAEFRRQKVPFWDPGRSPAC